MLIGIPKETTHHEYRVGMVPAGVRELTRQGHRLVVETGAGEGIGFCDQDYLAAGAEIAPTPQEVFARAEMMVKVKEPGPEERAMLRYDQLLFAYLHLAADQLQARQLIASGAVCVACETVTGPRGDLPLLAPMSEIAGRMAVQAGAQALEKAHHGRGLLLGGVPGVKPASVVILGGGVAGRNAAQVAVGLGADVAILDHDLEVLRRLDSQYHGRLKVIRATTDAIEQHVLGADLVIGSVLKPGGRAPQLISAQLVEAMKAGAVIVDLAITQGGCAETSIATFHDHPTYVVDEVVHYCVANMPGAVARTSTFALNNTTLPYIITLASQGYRQALSQDIHLRNGLNLMHGQVTCREVADSLGLAYTDPLLLLSQA